MRILVISPRFPYPLNSGANLRIFNIFKEMAKKHKIHLLCFIKSVEEVRSLSYLKDIFLTIDYVLMKCDGSHRFKRLLKFFSWNYGFSAEITCLSSCRKFRMKLQNIVFTHEVDIVFVHTLNMAQFCYNISAITKILDIADSRTLTHKRNLFLNKGNLLDRMRYYRVKRYESIITRYFDISTTVSKVDASIFKSLSPNINISVVPNGVDANYFHPLPQIEELFPSLIFWGNMDFPPNVDAVLHFYNSIFPLIKKQISKIRFFVVGSSPVEDITRLAKDKAVTVVGYVDDLRPWIAKGTVSICPMRLGAGIKNKILEAMAMQKPVVSTSLGAEAIDVSSGENIILADNSRDFAAKTVELLSNKPMRQKIAYGGRKLVERHYTWRTTAKKYEKLCSEITDFRTHGHSVLK